jgi:hypothetical protein
MRSCGEEDNLNHRSKVMSTRFNRDVCVTVSTKTGIVECESTYLGLCDLDLLITSVMHEVLELPHYGPLCLHDLVKLSHVVHADETGVAVSHKKAQSVTSSIASTKVRFSSHDEFFSCSVIAEK